MAYMLNRAYIIETIAYIDISPYEIILLVPDCPIYRLTILVLILLAFTYSGEIKKAPNSETPKKNITQWVLANTSIPFSFS